MAKIENMCLISVFVIGVAFISQEACASKPENAGKEPSFSYADPDKWGSIDKAYELCSIGRKQSPIDINIGSAVRTKYVPYEVTYNVSSASLVTTGLDVHLAVKGKCELSIDNRTYRLVSVRWHTPSEHTFSGKALDLEMQQVFEANDKTGNVAMIATFYKASPNGVSQALLMELDSEMKALEKTFDPKSNAPKSQDVEAAKLAKISQLLKGPPSKPYLRYSGSLTTPPCTQDVTWIILPNELSVREDQVNSIRNLLSAENKKNARPVHNLLDRQVMHVLIDAPKA